MKRILKLAVFGIAAIAALSSCSKNEDVPSQKDIETKIIGKWKSIQQNGKDNLTNERMTATFFDNGKEERSTSRYFEGVGYLWSNKNPYHYEIKGNSLTQKNLKDNMIHYAKVLSINNNSLNYLTEKIVTEKGEEIFPNDNIFFQKVTADYSQDIIGMWEGVEMTGDETYGDANHRIYYKEDGTYTYYDKVGDSWVPSKNAGNEYNVDGDWLATRWQPTEGADYEYEWWDIDEIKDGTMKWSALREKGDKTRYTTTFTWKKVNLPTQEEIETKIIGKWKEASINGEDALTNNRIVKTFYSNHAETESSSRYFDGVYIWFNKAPFRYEIKGNELIENEEEISLMIVSKITDIDETKLCANVYRRILPDGTEISDNSNFTFQKVTTDYSQDIIGMWEGVEMTGDETYGDANHRIYYKEDGTYTYYDKVGDSWVPSKNAGNEYNVDGDWLATRWQPTEGADYEYEWWDIVEIKDGSMKWSALREKGDGTRYTTTFTWKKVNLPTQEEIETKIIGKWKSIQQNGKDNLTNERMTATFFDNGKEERSASRYFEGVGYLWSNKNPYHYEIKGNSLTQKNLKDNMIHYAKVLSINNNSLNYLTEKIITERGEEIFPNDNIFFQKVTADYSQDIIGMWEGVEMTGDETYGDANHRIEYKADGTYVYYDKDGDDWKLSEDVDNEYNVDGDWLASRWRPKAGEDFEYEWWDIVEIKDGTMKWSALREKEDGTRYTTTFTWKKIQLQ